MQTYTQLEIFGTAEKKRIYFRDSLGRFASREMSEIERLYRENNRLKRELEEWRRKAETLVRDKIQKDRQQI